MMVDNFSAGVLLKLKGYKVHMTVRLDGNVAIITRIGPLSTHFQIRNGSDQRIEYSAISNNRLDFKDIRRLVRVYDDDKGSGEQGGL